MTSVNVVSPASDETTTVELPDAADTLSRMPVIERTMR